MRALIGLFFPRKMERMMWEQRWISQCVTERRSSAVAMRRKIIEAVAEKGTEEGISLIEEKDAVTMEEMKGHPDVTEI